MLLLTYRRTDAHVALRNKEALKDEGVTWCDFQSLEYLHKVPKDDIYLCQVKHLWDLIEITKHNPYILNHPRVFFHMPLEDRSIKMVNESGTPFAAILPRRRDHDEWALQDMVHRMTAQDRQDWEDQWEQATGDILSNRHAHQFIFVTAPDQSVLHYISQLKAFM